MPLSRIIGGVGRVMIATGSLLLLFVAYQLWGTGLRTDAAQKTLQNQFEAKKAEVQKAGVASAPGSPTTNVASSPTTVAATRATTPADGQPSATTEGRPASEPFPPPRPGEEIGRIVIPKIGADFYMVEGVDLNFLAAGPGHFPGTPFPGQPGNAALAGHRTTWKAPFNRIDELIPGDLISIETLQGLFTYEVQPQPGPGIDPVGHRIITPDQTEILDQLPGQNSLTLMACDPKYSASHRIVVVGKLVGNPAATTAKSTEAEAATQSVDAQALFGGSGGDLVGGNPEATKTAVLWGLVAAAVWASAWFITRRWSGWRNWPTWAVYIGAFAVFLVPLYFSFENVNQLLPAGY